VKLRLTPDTSQAHRASPGREGQAQGEDRRTGRGDGRRGEQERTRQGE